MARSPGNVLVEFFGKFVLSALIAGLSLTPFWIFLLVKNLLDPHGFWQKFLVLGVGVYFLGWLQIISFAGASALIFVLWTEA